jgi:hypothetical protein
MKIIYKKKNILDFKTSLLDPYLKNKINRKKN